MKDIELLYLENPKLITDLLIHDGKRFEDSRGYLDIEFEIHNLNSMSHSKSLSLKKSSSARGIARGLHWQNLKSPQTKIIKVLKGEILVCLVNMEHKNKGFLFRYSENDNFSIEISSNFAHGFYTFKPTTFQYLCIGKYSEINETTLNLFPSICEQLKIDEVEISSKDSAFPSLPVKITYN